MQKFNAPKVPSLGDSDETLSAIQAEARTLLTEIQFGERRLYAAELQTSTLQLQHDELFQRCEEYALPIIKTAAERKQKSDVVSLLHSVAQINRELVINTRLNGKHKRAWRCKIDETFSQVKCAHKF